MLKAVTHGLKRNLKQMKGREFFLVFLLWRLISVRSGRPAIFICNPSQDEVTVAAAKSAANDFYELVLEPFATRVYGDQELDRPLLHLGLVSIPAI